MFDELVTEYFEIAPPFFFLCKRNTITPLQILI